MRAPGTPARPELRADALRLALLVAATARALRCAPKREPPGLRFASACCAPPRPAREPKPAAKEKAHARKHARKSRRDQRSASTVFSVVRGCDEPETRATSPALFSSRRNTLRTSLGSEMRSVARKIYRENGRRAASPRSFKTPLKVPRRPRRSSVADDVAAWRRRETPPANGPWRWRVFAA